jgi:hypothetical protein
MANLFFPQLTSGASAQYPVGKTRIVRTIKNVLPDGSMIVLADPTSAQLYWQLSYANIALEDTTALQSHFDACFGPARAFTFIDPTDNMLVSSSNLTSAPWIVPSSVNLVPGAADPFGGAAAFTVTNRAEIAQEVTQTLAIPANYQYCFSIYATSASSSTITLTRQGTPPETPTTSDIGPIWTRVVSSGRLVDNALTFTVAVRLLAGQQVSLYGPQLEAQIAPSRYRPTAQSGGVYPAAHWAVDELVITAQAPNLFSTSFSIETSIQD